MTVQPPKTHTKMTNMTQPKSPFFVIEEFISPLMCEELLDIIDFTFPDEDREGNYIKTIKTSDKAEAILYDRFSLVIPDLETYYNLKYKGMERIMFEWFPEGSKGQFIAENSNFLRKKWLRTKNRDLTGILFLSEYQDKTPFETDYEVYGGKLEFVQHRFGFNPNRGTLVIFPSDPHFINITTEIFSGDLFQARIQIAAQVPFIYNPELFPGDYTVWFGLTHNK